RWFLRGSVLTLAAWFGYRWIIQPQLHGFSPEELATWVEKYDPQYRFRLISALQFGSDKPQLRDMSRPLMEAVIREAENQVEHASFSQLLSNQRYKRGAALLVLSTMAWLAYAGLHPVSILLQRLLGSDSAIPRQVQLHASAASLFPQGEPLQLEFTVTGRLPDALEGMVEVQPEGQAAERYPLIPLDTTSPARRYAASLPPSSKPFTYRAWLYDGRLRQRGEAVLVPRPVLRSWEASLILPSYVGTLPDGKPFDNPKAI
ncbi:MAG TPA: hypothetical protein PKA06_14110, partial [Gemmatales bacterium]|nr:hypothetical protein [Gemmatales bacterium]